MNMFEKPSVNNTDISVSAKKSQSPGSITMDASFFGAIGRDAARIEEISKITDVSERRRMLSEFYDEILNGIEKNFDQSVERIQIIKTNSSLLFEDFDNSWKQSQIDTIIESLFANQDNISFRKMSSLFDGIFYIPEEKYDPNKDLQKDTIRELTIKSVIKKIESQESLSSKSQEIIAFLSENLRQADIDDRLDFLITMFNSPEKFSKEKKNDTILNVSAFRSPYDLMEKIDQYAKSNDTEIHRIIKAIEFMQYIERLVRPETMHKRMKSKITSVLSDIEENNKEKRYFLYIQAKAALNNILGVISSREELQNPQLRDLAKHLGLGKKFSRFRSRNLIENEGYDPKKIKPLIPPDATTEDEKNASEFCIKLDEHFGVLYDSDGMVNSFFKLNKKNPKRVSLDEILKEEGMKTEKIGSEEYKKISLAYRTFINLKLRTEVEMVFGMRLENFSVREQLQFVNFISNNSFDEIFRMKDFLGRATTMKARQARIRSFLSFESDPQMKNIFFGEKDQEKFALAMPLVFDPTIKEETKDKLFLAYSKMIDESYRITNQILKMSQEIFPNKELDRNQILTALLKQSSEIFKSAQENFLLTNTTAAIERSTWINNKKFGSNDAERLVNYTKHVKDRILNDLITKIIKEQKSKVAATQEIQEIVSKLNEIYREVIMVEFRNNVTEFYRSNPQLIEYLKAESGDNLNSLLLKMMSESSHPVYRDLANGMKYDSQAIERMANYYRGPYSNITPENIEEVRKIIAQESAPDTPDSVIDQLVKISIKEAENDEQVLAFRKKYEPLVTKLEKFLKYQKNLEQKLDKLIYGKESAELATVVFEKYNEVVASCENIKQELQGKFSEIGITDDDMQEIYLTLFKKADEILHSHTGDEESQIQEALGELEDFKTKNIEDLSIIKQLGKKGLNMERMGIHLEEKTTSSFIGQDKNVIQEACEKYLIAFKEKRNVNEKAIIQDVLQGTENPELERKLNQVLQMLESYRINWKKNSQYTPALLEGFVSKILNGGEKTKLYMYTKQDDILVFLRIDDLDDGKKYFGSFNAKGDLKGLEAGDALLKKVMAELENETVLATCVPKEKVTSTYVEKFNFIINGADLNYADTNSPLLKIERAKKNSHYLYKNKSKEEIIKEYQEKYQEGEIPVNSQSFITRGLREGQNLTELVSRYTNTGEYVVSRFIIDPQNETYTYCVFEKKKD